MSEDRIPWDWSFPDQTCPGCQREHPGEPCPAMDPLPLEDE